MHDPMLPDSAHDRHALVQVVAQHTPWAQLPEMHSMRSEQNAPLGFFPHELPVQTLPGVQFASTVQLPKHCAPLQANGTHEMVTGSTQAPVALHVDSGVNTLLSQCAAAQTVPGRCRRQAPAPSQVPSVPHDSGGWAAQVLRGSSVPVATGVQTPGAEGRAQLRQAPVQASAQQTPSTQKFDTQSPAALHGWPLARLPQLPLMQTLLPTQSSLLVQRVDARAVRAAEGVAVLHARHPAAAEPVAGAGGVQPIARARRRDAHGLGQVAGAAADAVARAGGAAGAGRLHGAHAVRVGFVGIDRASRSPRGPAGCR